MYGHSEKEEYGQFEEALHKRMLSILSEQSIQGQRLGGQSASDGQPNGQPVQRGECFECKPHFAWVEFRRSINSIAMFSKAATVAVWQYQVWQAMQRHRLQQQQQQG